MKLKNLYNVEYIYNIDAGTVTAVARVERFDKNFLRFRDYYSYITGNYSKSKTVFSGVARLKAGDENNLKLAKRIARCKALRQANRYYGNLITKMVRAFNCLTLKVTDIGISTFRKAADYNNEINKLTKGE